MDESGHEPSKIWVDQGSEFYNRSMKSWLHDNCTEIYSTYNEEKSVVTETFIRALKSNIYKHMTGAEHNDKDPKFKVDGVRILRILRILLQKATFQIGLKKSS